MRIASSPSPLSPVPAGAGGHARRAMPRAAARPCPGCRSAGYGSHGSWLRGNGSWHGRRLPPGPSPGAGWRCAARPADATRRGRRRAGGDRCGAWRMSSRAAATASISSRSRSTLSSRSGCCRSPSAICPANSDMRHRWRVTRLWNSQLRPPPGHKGNCPSTRGWPGRRKPAGDRPPPGRWRSPARPVADARPRRLVAQGKALDPQHAAWTLVALQQVEVGALQADTGDVGKSRGRATARSTAPG